MRKQDVFKRRKKLNTTICCISTFSTSSSLGYIRSTALPFHIYTQRKTPLSAFTSGPATGIQAPPIALSSCSQGELTLFSPTSSDVLPQWSLLPHGVSCDVVPFSTVLQTSVLRRAGSAIRKGPRRGEAAGRNGYPNLSTWCSWKVKNTGEKGNNWFYNKKGITAFPHIVQKLGNKPSI